MNALAPRIEPDCSQCKPDCFSLANQASNSYGNGLSNGALYWLNENNPNWSVDYMRSENYENQNPNQLSERISE